MPGNIPFLILWQQISNCFRYVSTMANAVPIGLNWSDIQAFCSLSKTKLSPLMLQQIRFAEKTFIDEAVKFQSMKRS